MHPRLTGFLPGFALTLILGRPPGQRLPGLLKGFLSRGCHHPDSKLKQSEKNPPQNKSVEQKNELRKLQCILFFW
jgi:hypothetical protein